MIGDDRRSLEGRTMLNVVLVNSAKRRDNSQEEKEGAIKKVERERILIKTHK